MIGVTRISSEYMGPPLDLVWLLTPTSPPPLPLSSLPLSDLHWEPSAGRCDRCHAHPDLQHSAAGERERGTRRLSPYLSLYGGRASAMRPLLPLMNFVPDLLGDQSLTCACTFFTLSHLQVRFPGATVPGMEPVVKVRVIRSYDSHCHCIMMPLQMIPSSLFLR